MTTTENSRADALTDEQIRKVWLKHHADGREVDPFGFARKLLAAFPVDQPAAALSDWPHAANDWADAACNGVQWLKNIRDGISTAAEALVEMQLNIDRIRSQSSLHRPAAAPIPYDGLTEEFTDEVARLAHDAPGIREAVSGALESCNAIIAPQNDYAPVPSPADETASAPADLQGIRRAILTPRAIVRDEDGMLSHPAVPYLDEDVNYETFFDSFGIEAAFIHMENDVDGDTYDQYFASNSANCSFWTPTTPAGDGWLLLEIYDTEDGPVALYVREKKPESMRERWKREERERHAAAPSPADERTAHGDYVQWRMHANGMFGILSEIIGAGALARHGDDDLSDRVELAIANHEQMMGRAASANETGAEGAKVDPSARMNWSDGILRTLPPLHPTIAIEELLSQYGEDDKEEIFESIKAYADMRARQALSTQYAACSPAMAAEAVAHILPSDLEALRTYSKQCQVVLYREPRKTRVALYAAAQPAQADAREAPRYREWRHLREHGEWSNGVPDWAKAHDGRMNDFTAACAVIDELAALSSRSAGLTGEQRASCAVAADLAHANGLKSIASDLHVLAAHGANHAE